MKAPVDYVSYVGGARPISALKAPVNCVERGTTPEPRRRNRLLGVCVLALASVVLRFSWNLSGDWRE